MFARFSLRNLTIGQHLVIDRPIDGYSNKSDIFLYLQLDIQCSEELKPKCINSPQLVAIQTKEKFYISIRCDRPELILRIAFTSSLPLWKGFTSQNSQAAELHLQEQIFQGQPEPG